MASERKGGRMGMRAGWLALAGAAALLAAGAAGIGLSRIRSDAGFPSAPAGPVPPMQIGMNMGTPDYWSAEWPFVDLVQSTGTLMMTNAPGWFRLDAPGTPVPLDAAGRPVGTPVGPQLAAVLQLGSPVLPPGPFDCRISPGWTASAWGAWKMEGSGQRFRMRLASTDPKLGLVVMLNAQRTGAPLDQFSCRQEGVSPTEVFNAAFLKDYRPYRVLRFMDWMRTNTAGHRTWATRPTPASFSQAGQQGVSVEYMVALANRLDADPWFCLPFDADEDYYRRFAEYVRDHLRPDRRAYIELSNEVWNLDFPQGKLAREGGVKRYPGIDAGEAHDFYYADRVRDVMAAWTQVYGAQRGRIVRVLSSQAVWPQRLERTISHGDVRKYVDALATAPYFGPDWTRLKGTGAARVDSVFAEGPRFVGEAIGMAVAARAVAQRHGLRYVSYEGGPGFIHWQADFQADYLTVVHDPRMEKLYRLFLQRWKDEVGDLLVVYTGTFSSGGPHLWGHRDYSGQPLSETPKARALMDTAWGARTDDVPPAS